MKRFLEFIGSQRSDFLLALVLGAGLLLLQNFSLVQKADWFVFDQFTQRTGDLRPLDPNLRLVVIDDGSINELGSPKAYNWPWPWPRGAYASMITYLKASGAREIWFDLLFYTKDRDALWDDELLAVSQAAGNVHFGQGVGSDSQFKPTFDVTIPEIDLKGQGLHYDVSGRYLLGWPVAFEKLKSEEHSPIIPASRLVVEGDKLLKSLALDDREDPQKIVRLWRPGHPIPPGGESFQDKIVYVGISASSGFDLRSLPVGEKEPSFLIHVVERSNLSQKAFFRRTPGWVVSLVVLSSCCLISELFGKTANFYQFTGWTLACVLLVFLATYLLFIHLIWFPPSMVNLAIVSTFTLVTSANYLREGRKRKVVQVLFGKFVSSKVVDRLVARPDELKLGGEKAELTVLFSDLSGFTTLSEKMTSDVLLTMLNEYLNEMSELIYEREGTLDKYIGDAIMAFWGAPDASSHHALEACLAALACQRRLAELSPGWEERYGVKLTARIGINTDVMTVGMVGSNRLHNYSVIGDAVNLASRLEGANKPFGTSIMISQRTLDLAEGKIEVRPVALLQVKGKTKPVQVYELLGEVGKLSEKEKAFQRNFTEGYSAFIKKDWNKAQEQFHLTLQVRPGDQLAMLYLNRLQEYQCHPPEPDWQGVLKLDEK